MVMASPLFPEFFSFSFNSYGCYCTIFAADIKFEHIFNILMSIRAHSHLLFICKLVDISPTGPLYIPINTQRNITCHVEGSTIATWTIIHNETEQEFNPLIQESTIFGITGKFTDGVFNTLLITVNTTETSVTGLRCSNVILGTVFTSTIRLTIYGKLYIMFLLKIIT